MKKKIILGIIILLIILIGVLLLLIIPPITNTNYKEELKSSIYINTKLKKIDDVYKDNDKLKAELNNLNIEIKKITKVIEEKDKIIKNNEKD